jgi:hypothetical protein
MNTFTDRKNNIKHNEKASAIRPSAILRLQETLGVQILLKIRIAFESAFSVADNT